MPFKAYTPSRMSSQPGEVSLDTSSAVVPAWSERVGPCFGAETQSAAPPTSFSKSCSQLRPSDSNTTAA